MKNKLLTSLILYFFLNTFVFAEKFNFESTNIEIVNGGNKIFAQNGKAFTSDNSLEISSEKFEYTKDKNILNASGKGLALIKSENLKIEFENAVFDQKNLTIKADKNVRILQLEKKIIIESDSMIYNRNDQIIRSSGNVKIYPIDKKILIETDNIQLNNKSDLINSKSKTKVKDAKNNIYEADRFFYETDKNVLKLENVNFKDAENNKFSTSLAFINTKTNKLFGKDVKVTLNNKSFDQNNEPRLKANSIINDKEFSELTKGVFTTCKKRDGCPPWQLSAEKIQHDKKKQIINYKNALLKVYDVPIMYFPKFFHPDPTVKRKSGFLVPTIKNSSNSGNYLNTPYFFALAKNKDLTFSPRFYSNEKILLQNEYRQVNLNSNHISDFSFYSGTNEDSKSHFFYEYNKNYRSDNFEKNIIDLKIQQTSDDTYLKFNKLKSKIIQDNSTLENSFNIKMYSNDFNIETEFKSYENLNKNDSDRYEYILPKLTLVKKIENKTKLLGNFSFKSENLIKNYNTNIYEKTNVNNFIFSSLPNITRMGLYNNYDFIITNSNTDTQNSTKYKNDDNYYLSGIFQFNSSLPLIKERGNYQNILKPKFSLKIAPNFTKDISNEELKLDINNIYSINRISQHDVVEGGMSITYGNDFSIFNKENSKELLAIKLANNLRLSENSDLPTNNGLGEKTSDFFGEISFSPNKYLTTKYNASIKNNLSEINNENLISEFKVNNFVTSFDYLNENNIASKTSYLTSKAKYLLNDFNSIEFSTRENKTTDLTEYYNFIYKYKNDCLAASIEYNKDFYNDRDIKPDESIFLKLTIIPLGESSSPNFKK